MSVELIKAVAANKAMCAGHKSSMCINRQEGTISGKMMCRERKKLGPCPWWRAMFCIPWDLVKAAWFAIWRPVRKMFFTIY